MRHLRMCMQLSVLAILASAALMAEDGLISRTGAGHAGGGGYHAAPMDRSQINRDVNRDLNRWDYGSSGYDGGYITPAPVSPYDPLQDPNDDMNRVYQQNLQNMERTGH